MAELLENIVRAADRWTCLSRQRPPFPFERLPEDGNWREQERRHADRLAHAVLEKACELAGARLPPQNDIRVLKVLACRLCRLNREACCLGMASGKGGCPLGESAYADGSSIRST